MKLVTNALRGIDVIENPDPGAGNGSRPRIWAQIHYTVVRIRGYGAGPAPPTPNKKKKEKKMSEIRSSTGSLISY